MHAMTQDLTRSARASRKTCTKRAPVKPSAKLPKDLDGLPRDPDDYEWVPVLRKPRADGWSPTKQRLFIDALADTGSVEVAARAVDMSVRCCYKLRRAPGSEGFCAAWSAAIDAASKKLIDVAFDRAIRGTDEAVYLRDGSIAGYRARYNDKLLMLLLRAYMPERFRHAELNTRSPAEPKPPPLAPVSTALEQLGPPTPEAPQQLMGRAALKSALMIADMIPGKLPRWIPDVDPQRERLERTNPMPMGEGFERGLENAKREAVGKAPLSDDEWAKFKTDRGWDTWRDRVTFNDL